MLVKILVSPDSMFLRSTLEFLLRKVMYCQKLFSIFQIVYEYFLFLFSTHSSSTDDVLFCSPPSLLSINNNNNTKDGNQHSLSPSPVSVHSTANFITPLTATIKRENSAAYSTGSTNIQSPLFRRKKLKKKNLPRPFSPVYTNLNFYRVSNR